MREIKDDTDRWRDVPYSWVQVCKCSSLSCVQFFATPWRPVSSVHGISQARILEWVAISFSGKSSRLGIEPESPALQADSLPREPPVKSFSSLSWIINSAWLSFH